jgi:cellulose synthase (UDP-forming)
MIFHPKKLRLITAVVILLAAWAFAGTTSVVNARPSINGKLHVIGTGLFDEKGTQVVLKGASTHGLT